MSPSPVHDPLQECGALPTLSPVPGQLATLCARLNLSGHGITTPPARHLPKPWLSVLTQYQHRETGAAPVRDDCAAAAVVLPGLEGLRTRRSARSRQPATRRPS